MHKETPDIGLERTRRATLNTVLGHQHAANFGAVELQAEVELDVPAAVLIGNLVELGQGGEVDGPAAQFGQVACGGHARQETLGRLERRTLTLVGVPVQLLRIRDEEVGSENRVARVCAMGPMERARTRQLKPVFALQAIRRRTFNKLAEARAQPLALAQDSALSDQVCERGIVSHPSHIDMHRDAQLKRFSHTTVPPSFVVTNSGRRQWSSCSAGNRLFMQ